MLAFVAKAFDWLLAAFLASIIAVAGIVALVLLGFAIGVPLGIIVWCVRMGVSL
jgi:hypothetical protein